MLLHQCVALLRFARSHHGSPQRCGSRQASFFFRGALVFFGLSSGAGAYKTQDALVSTSCAPSPSCQVLRISIKGCIDVPGPKTNISSPSQTDSAMIPSVARTTIKQNLSRSQPLCSSKPAAAVHSCYRHNLRAAAVHGCRGGMGRGGGTFICWVVTSSGGSTCISSVAACCFRGDSERMPPAGYPCLLTLRDDGHTAA